MIMFSALLNTEGVIPDHNLLSPEKTKCLSILLLYSHPLKLYFNEHVPEVSLRLCFSFWSLYSSFRWIWHKRDRISKVPIPG